VGGELWKRLVSVGIDSARSHFRVLFRLVTLNLTAYPHETNLLILDRHRQELSARYLGGIEMVDDMSTGIAVGWCLGR
jgi:hypothetical protein